MGLEVMLIVVGKTEVMLMSVMVVMMLMVTVGNGDTGVWMEMTAGSGHCS